MQATDPGVEPPAHLPAWLGIGWTMAAGFCLGAFALDAHYARGSGPSLEGLADPLFAAGPILLLCWPVVVWFSRIGCGGALIGLPAGFLIGGVIMAAARPIWLDLKCREGSATACVATRLDRSPDPGWRKAVRRQICGGTPHPTSDPRRAAAECAALAFLDTAHARSVCRQLLQWFPQGHGGREWAAFACTAPELCSVYPRTHPDKELARICAQQREHPWLYRCNVLQAACKRGHTESCTSASRCLEYARAAR